MRLRVARKMQGFGPAVYRADRLRVARLRTRRVDRRYPPPPGLWVSRTFSVSIPIAPEAARALTASMARERRRLRKLPVKERRP